MNGEVVVMNGDVYQADGVEESPLVTNEPNERQKHVTIDGPSIITDKMSVFMVSFHVPTTHFKGFLVPPS